MAYADPQSTSNPTTGQPILAAWGDVVRDDLEYLARNKAHCRVYNSGAISVANATDQALTFNSERFDVGGCHSTSSNTSRLTVPSGEGGKYLIGGHVQYASNSAGNRAVFIRYNGTATLGREEFPSQGGFAEVVNLSITTIYALSAGDYVELVCNQTSGGALNVEAAAAASPEFWMMWMGV